MWAEEPRDRTFDLSSVYRSQQDTAPDLEPKLLSVYRIIQENLGDIEQARDIATLCEIPYETLRKDFRREAQGTLWSLVTRLRVQKMKQLLLETDLRCAEVGYAVGISREETSARIFRRETGCTMTDFRRRFCEVEDSGSE